MSATERALEVRGVSKTYASVQAVQDLSFEVCHGEIFGLLGPNGAGKTTTIKAILGLLRPDAGHVTLLGQPSSDVRVRRRIGYMPEQAYFPDQLSARELLLEHALLAGLRLAAARRRTAEVLERVGLPAARAGDRLRTFSKGMLQRVGLAQALVSDPELVILDEPMSGLDPLGRHLIKSIISELRGQGRTVFFSSHILSDIEDLCDRIGIIHRGCLLYAGDLHGFLTAGYSLEECFVSIIKERDHAANPL